MYSSIRVCFIYSCIQAYMWSCHFDMCSTKGKEQISSGGDRRNIGGKTSWAGWGTYWQLRYHKGVKGLGPLWRLGKRQFLCLVKAENNILLVLASPISKLSSFCLLTFSLGFYVFLLSLSIYQFISLSFYFFDCLSLCLSVCLSVCLSFTLSLSLSLSFYFKTRTLQFPYEASQCLMFCKSCLMDLMCTVLGISTHFSQ